MESRIIKKKIVTNTITIAIISLIIAIFFMPDGKVKSQQNEIDKNKTQVEITSKIIDIKESPSREAKSIGKVYEGEVYTVLDNIDKDGYFWYRIKTSNGIEGFIETDLNEDGIKVISGIIDRTAPTIIYPKDFMVFKDGKIIDEELSCIDDYSENCTFDFEIIDAEYIKVSAIDDAKNESNKYFKYYNVYSFNEVVVEDNLNVIATFKRSESNKNLIEAFYNLKRDIEKDNKSNNYIPVINFFDEDFNKVNITNIEYDAVKQDEKCINKSTTLKDSYIEKDLKEDDLICLNYNFLDDDRIKYFTVGFYGIENSNNIFNYLANYNSRYYIY